MSRLPTKTKTPWVCPRRKDSQVPNDIEKPAHVMQFFAFSHLPPHLREVSEPFCTLASWIELHLPDNPERAKALDLLLVSKDAAVRAKLAR